MLRMDLQQSCLLKGAARNVLGIFSKTGIKCRAVMPSRPRVKMDPAVTSLFTSPLTRCPLSFGDSDFNTFGSGRSIPIVEAVLSLKTLRFTNLTSYLRRCTPWASLWIYRISTYMHAVVMRNSHVIRARQPPSFSYSKIPAVPCP